MRHILIFTAMVVSQIANAGIPKVKVILDGGETKNYTYNLTKEGDVLKLPTATKSECRFYLLERSKPGGSSVDVYRLGCCAGKTCVSTVLSCAPTDTNSYQRPIHLETEGKYVVLLASCD